MPHCSHLAQAFWRQLMCFEHIATKLLGKVPVIKLGSKEFMTNTLFSTVTEHFFAWPIKQQYDFDIWEPKLWLFKIHHDGTKLFCYNWVFTTCNWFQWLWNMSWKKTTQSWSGKNFIFRSGKGLSLFCWLGCSDLIKSEIALDEWIWPPMFNSTGQVWLLEFKLRPCQAHGLGNNIKISVCTVTQDKIP